MYWKYYDLWLVVKPSKVILNFYEPMTRMSLEKQKAFAFGCALHVVRTEEEKELLFRSLRKEVYSLPEMENKAVYRAILAQLDFEITENANYARCAASYCNRQEEEWQRGWFNLLWTPTFNPVFKNVSPG